MKQKIQEDIRSSKLKDTLYSAIAHLDDIKVQNITITDVICKKGKYDADVFVYVSNLSKKEINDVLECLNKAKKTIQQYCLIYSGWFKCPKLHFKFDESIEAGNRIEAIFEQIKKANVKH